MLCAEEQKTWASHTQVPTDKKLGHPIPKSRKKNFGIRITKFRKIRLGHPIPKSRPTKNLDIRYPSPDQQKTWASHTQVPTNKKLGHPIPKFFIDLLTHSLIHPPTYSPTYYAISPTSANSFIYIIYILIYIYYINKRVGRCWGRTKRV